MDMKKWFTIETPLTTWLVDMEFMLSGYNCSWGSGCKGIQDSECGCCAIGTPIFDEELAEVRKRAEMLTEDEWQFKSKKWLKRHKRKDYGTKYNTRIFLYDGASACIFHNRSDFAGGAGCAFHVAAMKRGESPLDWKPDTCWQVPLAVAWVDELSAYVVRMVSRSDWSDGWEDYDTVQWWCTDDDISWHNRVPVFMSLAAELERMIGSEDPDAWPKIKAVCEDIWSEMPVVTGPKPVPVTLRGYKGKY